MDRPESDDAMVPGARDDDPPGDGDMTDRRPDRTADPRSHANMSGNDHLRVRMRGDDDTAGLELACGQNDQHPN